jgi:ferric-dicitrate binding protein FerR (iron transport regulator)
LWLTQSPDNKKEYERMRQIWESSSALKIERDADVDAAWQDFKQRAANSVPEKRIKRVLVVRMAAGIALIAVLTIIVNFVLQPQGSDENIASLQKAPVFVNALPESALYDTILMDGDSTDTATPDSTLPIKKPNGKYKRSGKTKNVIMVTFSTRDSARAFYLPDKSIVFLNDYSTLVYEEGFGKKNRKVNLVGEAYFEVVKDTMPFVVTCANTVSKGTNCYFNVHENKQNESVEVITVSGKIEFSGVGKNTYKTLVLKEGERGIFGKDEALVKEKNKNKDFKWWQKKNLRAKLRQLLNKIKNTFK